MDHRLLADMATHTLEGAFFVVLGVLLLYPLPLFTLLGYGFFASYIAWAFALCSLFACLRVRAYHNGMTAALWLLRWLMVVIFLVGTFRVGARPADFVAIAGTLIPTFFYELGCVLAFQRASFDRFLRVLELMAVASALPISIKAAWLLIQQGPAGLLYSVSALRQIDPGWPNYFGMQISICVLIALYLRKQSRVYDVVLWLTLAMLFLTLSRTAIVGLAVACLVFILPHFRKLSAAHPFSLLVCLILAASLLLIMFQYKEAVEGSGLSRSLSDRTARWVTALSEISEHPWIGLGFRSFATNIASYKIGTDVRDMGSSHNDYIDLLLRGGAVFASFYAFYVLTAVRRMYRRAIRERTFSLIALCLAVVSTVLAGGVFQNPLKDGSLSTLFWLFMGAGILMTSSANLETDSTCARARSRGSS